MLCWLLMLVFTPATLAQTSQRQTKPKPAATFVNYAARDEVQQFVQMMVTKHGLEAQPLLDVFAQAQFDPSIVRLMNPAPAGFKRSWAVYRQRFLDPLRIREGMKFWQTHQSAISRASQEYGVPESIIVSIIGVETLYGRIMGEYRVLDALTVLSFDYPRRASFFREELESFLLLTRDEPAQRLSWKGSFAGAVGLPQFMPGSIVRHATDFDGDGKINLRDSAGDAVGSVARFLARHGWRRDEPTHFNVSIADASQVPGLIAAGIEPHATMAQLQAMGLSTGATIDADMKLAFIDLPNGDDAPSYYLGAPNFYVITRYNRSSFYAMAVIELAAALRERR
jgi:membrane-bound lytic murein transglycosylase B